MDKDEYYDDLHFLAYLEQQRENDAMHSYYIKILNEKDPQEMEIFVRNARERGKFNEAILILHRLLRIDPNNENYLFLLESCKRGLELDARC
jgi:Flp pilus assembly protein TadD